MQPVDPIPAVRRRLAVAGGTYLNPRNNWENPADYDEQAAKLAKLFAENIVSFAPSQDIVNAGPQG